MHNHQRSGDVIAQARLQFQFWTGKTHLWKSDARRRIKKALFPLDLN